MGQRRFVQEGLANTARDAHWRRECGFPNIPDHPSNKRDCFAAHVLKPQYESNTCRGEMQHCKVRAGAWHLTSPERANRSREDCGAESLTHEVMYVNQVLNYVVQGSKRRYVCAP
jgi:hypothetical protein